MHLGTLHRLGSITSPSRNINRESERKREREREKRQKQKRESKRKKLSRWSCVEW